MQQIKKRPAVAERFVLWPLGLEADGPSPINSRRYCLRTVKLKISKFYFLGNICHLWDSPLIGGGGYVLLFLACDTIPRFLSFLMEICGMGENLFLCSLGEMDIFVPGRATYEPRPPLHRGYPSPAAACPSPADRHKKIPPSVLLHLRPVPGFSLLLRCFWPLFR